MLKLETLLPTIRFRDNFVKVIRKWTISILAVLYLGLSSGFVVNWHYCMGELSSVDFGHATTEVCGKCGMKDQKGCCETHSKMVKVQDEHQVVKSTVSSPVVSEVMIQDGILPIPTFASSHTSPSYNYGIPPGLNGRNRHLFLSVFRI